MSYAPGYSFSGFQANRPDEPLPGASVDAELANIAAAITDLQTRLETIRRSDGALKNGVVTADALANDIKATYTGGAVSAWAPVVAYAAAIAATTTAPATVVVYSGETYVCAEDHTTTATFEPAKWTKIAAKGANGAGIGDLLAANNLDDVVDPVQALANLGGVPLAGGTMTGLLVLSGDAAASDGAVTKSQMETALLTKVSASALAAVATTGAYTDLSGRPALGTAASQSTGTAAGNVVQYSATNKLPAADGSALLNLPIAPHVIAEDRKSSGTDGQSLGATSGTWYKRNITTLMRNSIGASLASDQITLPAGTYYITWRAPGYKTREHKTRLYNASTSAVLAYGSSEYSHTDMAVSTDSTGAVVVTLSATQAIQLDHYAYAVSPYGPLGKASGAGTEIYTHIDIWKVS